MEWILIALGALLIFLGIIGCVLPIIPGPPLAYGGIILLHLTSKAQFSSQFLIIWGIIVAVVTILDYMIPVWGTKRFGGSKRGVWGSMIGLVVGLFFFPPFGIIVGPFAGAVIGEVTAGNDSRSALKSGFGSFVGFVFATLLKLIVSGWLCWKFVAAFF
ncbi:DUF456 domain-containing protein [Prolixibacteraceae bacterium JC049]|jgi:uncharacterized protein YqgC (DUF456 family)|nr:DUF456 domain-containing protein [Prolixibacteraceae bacterium JC049]